jgi:hypothetical protein
MYAMRFGVVLASPPSPLAPLGKASLSLVTTKAAMADVGIAWLFTAITTSIKARTRR